MSNKCNFTFLFIGHDEIVDLLIRKGANVKILTPEGMSALDLAEQNGNQ